MPTYDYACDSCGFRFEKFQSFKEDSIKICPVCGAEAVRKLISPTSVIFKGSGWYITDSRKSNSAATPAVTTSESTKPDGVTAESKPAEDKGTDSKPAESKPTVAPTGDKKSEAAA